MQPYELRGNAFIIRDYARKAPFSSFLPGLTGVEGIPIWSFYTNRGQGVCSFGIHNKGNAMMEFSPANTGYENTQVRSFRTFLRVDGAYYEPFFRADEQAERVMEIEKNTFAVWEEHAGLRVTARYFILPNESIGALVRDVTIENKTGRTVSLEVLDGMPQVIPYGVQNGLYKEMSNLYKSWADIRNAERNAPIYKMRASGDDTAEVKDIAGGWFYLSVLDGELTPVIYDKSAVFGFDQSMMDPLVFRREGLRGVLDTPQCFVNKVPCAFVPAACELKAGEALSFTAYMGFAVSEDFLNEKAMLFRSAGYAAGKLTEARASAVWVFTSFVS